MSTSVALLPVAANASNSNSICPAGTRESDRPWRMRKGGVPGFV
jgi:hypothetical protein